MQKHYVAEYKSRNIIYIIENNTWASDCLNRSNYIFNLLQPFSKVKEAKVAAILAAPLKLTAGLIQKATPANSKANITQHPRSGPVLDYIIICSQLHNYNEAVNLSQLQYLTLYWAKRNTHIAGWSWCLYILHLIASAIYNQIHQGHVQTSRKHT